MKTFYYFILPILFFVSACAMPPELGPDLESVSSRYCEAMRWRDVSGAANFLLKEHRDSFRLQFADEDLHVVESRIVAVQLDEDGENASAEYLLEYYLLPSSRIRKWRWQQQWKMLRPELASTGIWQIQNTAPAFP